MKEQNKNLTRQELKIRLDCLCRGGHSLEIVRYPDDKDWPCIIRITSAHATLWEKIKYLFKTDWFVDDIIINNKQLKKIRKFFNKEGKCTTIEPKMNG